MVRGHRPRGAEVLNRARAWVAAPGILIAAVLTLPDLRLRYFWDDYWFLSRAQTPSLHALLPEQDFFYRPISRVLYFWPLAPLGSAGAPLAHAVNLILVLVSVWLLSSLVQRLAGWKAGAMAGIAFASLATVPCLVAWASASQDLLAIVFVLIAFHLRLSGRVVASGVAFAAGLLSKETTAVLAPALVFLDWVVGVKPGRTGRAAGVLGVVLTAWILLHPGLHRLVAARFAVEPRQYVGFSNVAVAELHARRYLLALFNIPRSPDLSWRGVWLVAALFVAGVSAVGLALLGRHANRQEPEHRLSLARAMLLALAISAPTLILPAFLLNSWAGYLACFPGVGAAILIGTLCGRLPTSVGIALLTIFALLGVAIRGSRAPNGEPVNELYFAEASRAIQGVESAFRKLHPTFPRGSQLVVSVAASGPLGIDGTMHDGQAPRIWYGDPTLRVVRPQRREPSASEYLFRVTGSELWEIRPDDEVVRTNGAIADREEVRAVIRTYSRGLAASGEAARATKILRRLAKDDPERWASYDLRLASMAMLAAHDSTGAARLRAQAGPITREFALYALAKVFGEPTGRADLDSSAYAAFGISPRDEGALRYWMNMFYASQIVPQARDFALRLREIAPADSESAYILERLSVRPRGFTETR